MTGVTSEICIHDIADGRTRVLLRLDAHVEAPNWAPDGSHLVVNSGGRLFRVPLDAPRMEPIDTGFAQICNNDHGLSPDGKLLAISDSTEGGGSAIFVLPAAGGTPRRVTDKTPSYWHGWSPDGARLAYVGRRGDGFQVHTCAVTGGDERRITSGFDHCDGPDYTPDGQWIWFNGEKDGAVELWRIRPDGSDLQRMTDDDQVNWFPHPSPCGKWVLYLAYPPGTQGHPFGRDVMLRLMPAQGGPARDLVRLYGGQGTINVPCWAPDSRQFAFARFEGSPG